MENEESFLTVLSAHNIESLLSSSDIQLIQTKLWDILAKRVESYTMGGSSSVRAETAQELLKSAGFVLRKGMETAGGQESIKDHLLNDDFDAVLKAGLIEIKALVCKGEALLETANKTALTVENRAYCDTLRELGVFFKRYHYHHFAHEIPCMLDYPLAHPVDEALLGIDYINEYLRRLLIENEFCSRFDPATVTLLLRSISPDCKENLLNIYEAVAANASALTLLGGDIVGLDVTELDRSRLLSLLGALTDDSAPVKLRGVTDGLCAILGISGDAAREYLGLTVSDLYLRLKPALAVRRLEHIFPPLYCERPEKKTAVTYIDGALMDNEILRTLIDALTSCRNVSDKIALARQHVTSLRDWAEVLGICFWGDEFPELFAAFSAAEIDLLLRYVREKQRKYPEWISETGWEDALMTYINERLPGGNPRAEIL